MVGSKGNTAKQEGDLKPVETVAKKSSKKAKNTSRNSAGKSVPTKSTKNTRVNISGRKMKGEVSEKNVVKNTTKIERKTEKKHDSKTKDVAKVRLWKRIWYITSSVLVILILICSLVLVGLRLAGLNMFTVMSGSMEPTYPVGSVVYTRGVNPDELNSGDVITFATDEDTVVTHRIVTVITQTDENGEIVTKFRTKGDANKTTDGKLVDSRNVIGVPVFSVPSLGYVSFYLQRPPGVYIALIVGTALIVSAIVPSVIKFKERRERSASKKK